MSPKSIVQSLIDEFSCEVSVQNRSAQSLARLDDLLAAVAELVLRFEGRQSWWNISIVLTTDEHLRWLHAEHLDDDSVTDVMSFQYGSEVFDFVTFGEIVISVDRAIEQAAEAGWTTTEEITFLVTHGMLHLCGWSDSDTKSQEAMLARQHEIMSSLPFSGRLLP